jgi:tight adherence protein B
MFLLLAYGFTFGSVAAVVAIAYPQLTQRFIEYVDRQSALAAAELSDVFLNPSQRTVWVLYAAAPLIIGVIAVLATGRLIFGVIGLALGILIPSFLVKQARARHRKKFHDQLIDGLLLLSSSLKAGLSMAQAFTVIAEEMPTPISQEFGLILKETRMGVNIDEALMHMKQRVPGDDVSLFITAVLVARETGGDITHVFGRLVETLRDRKKLKERIATLTFMARMQGFVMAMLPFAFGFLVYQMNKDYFRFFVFEPLGRMMLAAIILMQVIGTLLYMRFSRSPL